MARHNVELTWDGESQTISANPDPVPVQAGDSISFKMIDPPRARAIIVFKDPQLFSSDLYLEGDTPVIVKTAASTKYICHATVDGELLDPSNKAPGNSIEPGTGDSIATAAKPAKAVGAAANAGQPPKVS